MISNSEIRKRAREALGGHIFSDAWLYAMLVLFIVTLITTALIFTYVGTILVVGIFSCATSSYFISRVRGRSAPRDLGVAVEGASSDFGGNIILGVLHTILIALWTLLFVVPGIVKSCSYALTYYVKSDNPGISARDAIRESERLMDGYKMQYFLLQLSFIGWAIVGLFALGIGTLWVNAYMESAKAVFYEQVLEARGESVRLDFEN